MDLDEMAKRAHDNATAKGFHSVPVGAVQRTIVMLGLEMQETAEEVEKVRKDPKRLEELSGILESTPAVAVLSDTQVELAAQAVLIATECVELFDAVLKADWENAREELADIIIRAGDTFHELLKASTPIAVLSGSIRTDLNLESGAVHLEVGEQLSFLPMLTLSSEVDRKMQANEARPHLHGKAR